MMERKRRAGSHADVYVRRTTRSDKTRGAIKAATEAETKKTLGDWLSRAKVLFFVTCIDRYTIPAPFHMSDPPHSVHTLTLKQARLLVLNGMPSPGRGLNGTTTIAAGDGAALDDGNKEGNLGGADAAAATGAGSLTVASSIDSAAAAGTAAGDCILCHLVGRKGAASNGTAVLLLLLVLLVLLLLALIVLLLSRVDALAAQVAALQQGKGTVARVD